MSETRPRRPDGDGEPLFWRAIPLNAPPFLHALLVTAIALGTALGLRLVVMGFPHGWGISSTFFPAFIVATLFAGPRWGWGVWAVAMAIGLTAPGNAAVGFPQQGALALFGLSGGLTVMASSALRTALVRLRESADLQRESEARFRSLADSAPSLMWVSRVGGARHFVNTAYIAFVGGSYDDALHVDWRTRLHPDDLQRILKEQVAGEGAHKPFSLEARYRRADGEWRWLKSFSQPRLDPAGEFSGFAGIAFDVTEAKQVEADLQRINELLEERVDLAVAERDQAQAALDQSQKLEALGRLTGGVAHDFNNLLTVIIGALDIVLRHPENTARTARLGKAALDAAQRGERLTRQLLAFSRRQPLRPEPVSLDSLIRQSEPLYRGALGERFMLDLSLKAGDGTVSVDAAQFDAAVMNLLVNARDAMSGGGVVLLATALVRRAAGADDLPAGDYVAISVQDNGEGMDEATRARVFEPFFSTKPVGKGTGLGLSQVYGFVRQSGGGVLVDSAPGRGTTLTLLLPLDRSTPEDADGTRPATWPDTPALDILLVEDDPQVAVLAEAMLRELGHRVQVVDNPARALALVREEAHFGLLLTDVVMPGDMTGVDLARKAVAARPGLPVLLSSGYTGEVLASAEDAPWPLLRKPYTLDVLAAAIAQTVSDADPGAAGD
ncbi:MAG: PAS domain S-box protein [Caulobacter sp.]|nr:PAS domain S-box protein [Caulobacter sp.]